MFLGRFRGFIRVFIAEMSSKINISLVPSCVRGMKVLERDKFLHNVAVPVLKLTTDKVNKVQPVCQPYILKLNNFKPVKDLGEEDKPFEKCIYLHPKKVSSWNDIPEDSRVSLKECDVTETNLDFKETQVGYENFSYTDIFNAVLPEGEETVSGFTQIGHIIHLNLRPPLFEYKTLIGQVLIDKIKTCRTVVNKTDIIDNTYRNFNMELLAGDEDLIVTVKENRCNFQFDFSKVYWNSRLGKEHERIINLVKPDDILFDVFSGVGPFAIPIAKKKCRVFANDLNPESFKWLNHNAALNKVKMPYFKSYNLDGKDFICNTFKDFLTDYCNGKEVLESGTKIHVTMNLPALAVEFLKYFNGLIDDRTLYEKCNCDIIVYVYCFALGDNPIETARKMVNENIGQDITSLVLDVFNVRNVAPKKEMMRVTFKLTKDLLFGISSELDCEPPLKKKCVDIGAQN